jgi:acetylornithine deacetylase/succinyl-diaminopimelate desuccinylase-like protein
MASRGGPLSVSNIVDTLTAQQRHWVDAAWASIDRDVLARLLTAMVNIPSPPGEERALAEFIAGHLREHGLRVHCQFLDDQQANAVGVCPGRGGGADLLLYSPIDTAFTGTEIDDLPWTGASLRPDLVPVATTQDGFVVGLGAENPKGYAACIIGAAEAIARAGIPLLGDLVVGLGAGGMPANAPLHRRGRRNIGQGVGCAHMLEQGVRGDFALIAKPGWTVSYEEVGVCWFRIDVKGTLAYTGMRHILPYQNAIVAAGEVTQALERWFPEYTARNTSGAVAPQGSIGAIVGGWPHKPAFTPAVCQIHVDLRVNPRTSPSGVKAQFAQAMDEIHRAHPHLDFGWEMILGIPGSHSDPDGWIVRAAVRGWEALEGRPHVAEGNKSGATDANILRQWGVPTARIGMPRPPSSGPFAGQFSMGVVHLESVYTLIKLLIHVAVDTCTRPRRELGLES